MFVSIPPILFSFYCSRQALIHQDLKKLEEVNASNKAESLNNTTTATTGSLKNNVNSNHTNAQYHAMYLRQRNKYVKKLGLGKISEYENSLNSKRLKLKQKKMLEDGKNTALEKLEKEILYTPKIRQAYWIQASIKFAVECLFLYFQYVLQTFQNPQATDLRDIYRVPERYMCEVGKEGRESPCSQNDKIMCWNIRPYEKTVMLYYMTSMHFLCLLVCMLELIYIPYRGTKHGCFGRKNKNLEIEDRRVTGSNKKTRSSYDRQHTVNFSEPYLR